MSKIFKINLISIVIFIFVSFTNAATFEVDRSDDALVSACTAAANDCTLRGAITASNTGGGIQDTINFSIPGGGVHTINLTSPLPAITASVTINGATQTGYFGTPLIELNGTSAGAGSIDGLLFSGIGGLSTSFSVYALAINRFSGNGVKLACPSTSNCDLTLLGNFIGTNPAGTLDLGNTLNGVWIEFTPFGNYQIGGTGVFENNLISGNNANGIFITAPNDLNLTATDTVAILGNQIGTNFGATADLGNSGDGIKISSIHFDNFPTISIGGSNSNARNIISGNDTNGIYIDSGGNPKILGNYIGTNSAGITDLGNTQSGIYVESESVEIGGVASGAGNLISGNNQNGIFLNNLSNFNKIFGNLIGTNAGGTSALGNSQHGIYSLNAGFHDIGLENDTASGNLISGNLGSGIKLEESRETKIFNNKIGTNLSGTAKIANLGNGLQISEISGSFLGDHRVKKNVISGNGLSGVEILGIKAKASVFESNFIGTNSNGDNLGNNGRGVYITSNASENIVGGITANAGNAIAFNGDDGIGSDSGTKNALRQNSIYSNAGLGIDLGISGVTLNDTNDADSGANDLQNFPVLTTVTPNLILGSLNSTANTNFTVEFYRVDSCDGSGNGEGRYYLGSANVSTPPVGNDAAINVSNIPLIAGQIITAIATDASGNTSEFSQCKTVSPPPGDLTFSAATYTVNESASIRTIVVNRTGSSSGTITVDYAVTNGTATSPADFNSQSGTLTFNNGEVVKSFDVAVVNDTTDEPDETINLALSNPSAGVNLTPNATAVLTILDNDNPPSISISDVSMAEGQSGTKNFNFNVELSEASGFDISVDFATANGTANSPVDFTAQNGTLNFSSLSSETTKTISVSVNSDFVPELDETFFVNLSNSTNATFGDNQALGTILDDDNPGKFKFSFAPYSGTEHDSVQVTVARTNGTAGTVSVDYATQGGTATPITDYTPVAGTLIFGDGETIKTFNVSLADDNVPEPAEAVDLILSNPNGGATLGNPSTAVLNIFDNDNGTLLNLAGEVKLADNSPVANVTINLQGTQNASVMTNNQGRYSFPNLAPNGNYSVTPSALGFTFDPISRTFNNLTADELSANFSATPAPSRQVRVVGGNATPGQNVQAVVELAAQGDENSVGFSINYDSAILFNPQVVLHADASSAFLTVNNSQSGKLGILIALPAGQAFTVGTKSLVTITFNTMATNVYNSPVTFGDVPLVREIANTNANELTAGYLDGAVTFAQGYEADVAPRPTGTNNGTVTITDFTQVGRFVAGLDTLDTNFNEFQRADSAPRISLGNGQITVSDYTQAGRYAAGLDIVNPAGGASIQSFAPEFIDAKELKNSLLVPTVVRVVNIDTSAGQQVIVSIETDAQGTENGFGFSLNYDSAKLNNPVVAKGTDTQTATLIPNILQSGKIGVVLALPFGQAIQSGTRQLVTITFNVAANASPGQTPLTFGDMPAFREVSDVDANVLQSSYQEGVINILGPTAANVSISGRVLTAQGRGVSRARLIITASDGTTRTAMTNPFGYFRFVEMSAGETYLLTVQHKQYKFNPASKIISTFEDATEVNFIVTQKQ